MSRIGQKPIEVPDKVKVAVNGPLVNIEGPRGKLKHTLPSGIEARLDGKTLLVEKKGETRQHRALHGLSRALLANFVQGAHEGFQTKLEIQGVGFKAALNGKSLSLNLGFSHPVNYPVPDDITGKTLVSAFTTEKSLVSSKLRPNVKGAGEIGKLVAERAKAKNITQVVFDRGGFTYHGKVKALADAARQTGLQF